MFFLSKYHLRWCGLVLVLFGAVSTPAAAADVLPPEQAFQVTAQATTPTTVEVRWALAKGYYLYRDKFQITTTTPGITLAVPQFPAAETKQDQWFGKMAVYHHDGAVAVPLRRTADAPNQLALAVTVQGCADAGFCYPPLRRELVVTLPPMPEEPAAAEPAPFNLRQALNVSGADDLLPVDEAFQFAAEVVAADRLLLRWDIAPDTYIYRQTLKVALENGDGTVTLGTVTRPPGGVKTETSLPDGTVGEAEVYHDQLEFAVPLVRTAAAASAFDLVVSYQGCAELGVCYPPQMQRVRLTVPELRTLPAAMNGTLPTAPATASPTTSEASLSDDTTNPADIAAVLAGGNWWLIGGVFFGFGLLLAFTPCLFPMIPILSGIIVGQGAALTTRRAFVLSLVYVLAMALTYTLAGIAAGLFGANLQIAFQSPWIISSFVLIFVLLALSMFGFYDLQLPSRLQTKLAALSHHQQRGTLIGVAVMGVLSALIVGPCVAPPLFGALLYISQTGDAALGGLALFALSLGMGAPLLVIGTSAGRLLPRAGAWMEVTKTVFGVLLLGVAITLLERIVPAALALALWGMLSIGSAIYLGALTLLPAEVSGWRKLWQGLGVVLLIEGAVLLIGAAAGGSNPLQPLRGLFVSTAGAAGTAPAGLTFQRVKTVADVELALAAAKAAGRPVLLDFYADWCVSCKELERDTFGNAAVRKELQKFVRLQADVTANDAADQALMQEQFGVFGPPALFFFDAAGHEIPAARLVGTISAAALVAHVRRFVP